MIQKLNRQSCLGQVEHSRVEGRGEVARDMSRSKVPRGFPQQVVYMLVEGAAVLVLEPGHIGQVRLGVVHDLQNERLLVLIPFQLQLCRHNTNRQLQIRAGIAYFKRRELTHK